MTPILRFSGRNEMIWEGRQTRGVQSSELLKFGSLRKKEKQQQKKKKQHQKTPATKKEQKQHATHGKKGQKSNTRPGTPQQKGGPGQKPPIGGAGGTPAPQRKDEAYVDTRTPGRERRNRHPHATGVRWFASGPGKRESGRRSEGGPSTEAAPQVGRKHCKGGRRRQEKARKTAWLLRPSPPKKPTFITSDLNLLRRRLGRNKPVTWGLANTLSELGKDGSPGT